jgi:hypothetical protein
MIDLIGRYSFGAGGTARPFLTQGWSHLEPDFTWTEGTRSQLRLPCTAVRGRLMLEMRVSPMLMPPVFRRQRLNVSVNGVQIAEELVGGDCFLGLEVPPEARAGADALDIVLECPDAQVPKQIGAGPDERQLGVSVHDMLLFDTPEPAPFTPRLRPPLPANAGGLANAVHALTGLSVPELAGHFESLGHNCEFGIAQRQMGCEPLGLLRFAGIPAHLLVEGLDFGFEGIAAPGNLITYVNDDTLIERGRTGEFMVRDVRYGTNFHSEMGTEATTAEAVIATFTRSLDFLRRKLVEDLAGGHKIFVFQHPEARSIAHVRPILNLLRSYGPNTLLFVTANDGHAAGSVEQLAPDLFHGWVNHLAPVYNVRQLDLPSWIQVCANTYRLWREAGHGA